MSADEYGYDRQRATPPPAPRPPRVDCSTCGGDGLRTVRVIVHGLPGTEMVACTCSAGTERRPMIARARHANDTEHAALGTPYRQPPATPPPPRPEPLL